MYLYDMSVSSGNYVNEKYILVSRSTTADFEQVIVGTLPA